MPTHKLLIINNLLLLKLKIKQAEFFAKPIHFWQTNGKSVRMWESFTDLFTIAPSFPRKALFGTDKQGFYAHLLNIENPKR